MSQDAIRASDGPRHTKPGDFRMGSHCAASSMCHCFAMSLSIHAIFIICACLVVGTLSQGHGAASVPFLLQALLPYTLSSGPPQISFAHCIATPRPNEPLVEIDGLYAHETERTWPPTFDIITDIVVGTHRFPPTTKSLLVYTIASGQFFPPIPGRMASPCPTLPVGNAPVRPSRQRSARHKFQRGAFYRELLLAPSPAPHRLFLLLVTSFCTATARDLSFSDSRRTQQHRSMGYDDQRRIQSGLDPGAGHARVEHRGILASLLTRHRLIG